MLSDEIELLRIQDLKLKRCKKRALERLNKLVISLENLWSLDKVLAVHGLFIIVQRLLLQKKDLLLCINLCNNKSIILKGGIRTQSMDQII